MMSDEKILEIKNLRFHFQTQDGEVQAVRDINLSLNKGKTLGIVGESGCGKSVTFQSILNLVPIPPGKLISGEVIFQGKDLLNLSVAERKQILGKEIGVIFQDPMSSLNPTMTIGNQLSEVLQVHYDFGKAEIQEKVLEVLNQVEISKPSQRMNQYPFEFSGGMLQRVMIAMSIIRKPKLIIADEPTTALDVTIQAQILELLQKLQSDYGMSLIIISHDLGVIAKMSDEIAVMYAGQVVELGKAEDVLLNPRHPYTVGLKKSIPSPEKTSSSLYVIPGTPPDLLYPPEGCSFKYRCENAMRICDQKDPDYFGSKTKSKCWLEKVT